MTQFTCSHHGILRRGIITTSLDAKIKSKNTCFLCEEINQAKTPDFTHGRFYRRVKLFSIQHKIVDFYKDFYIQEIGKLAYHCSYYKKHEKHQVDDVRYK